ncbi:hypothetical protein PoB_007653400 [Plakobranchus ocellatus]|uniref:Uncharacterized protein n=1 Tax=Plakobranchus ocellatus TaxID=259542 RepID=A0AAV4E165_9GAST|nr:hypothetical protein PoB_007653400 [Plakobranchus ocellatus]
MILHLTNGRIQFSRKHWLCASRLMSTIQRRPGCFGDCFYGFERPGAPWKKGPKGQDYCVDLCQHGWKPQIALVSYSQIQDLAMLQRCKQASCQLPRLVNSKAWMTAAIFTLWI